MEVATPAAEANARRLRREPSSTERLGWKLLRDRRLAGYKFRRQVAIGRYVADFVCFQERLIVEFDGPLHDPEADAKRDEWFEGQNFAVLRFANEQLSQQRDVVLRLILETMQARR